MLSIRLNETFFGVMHAVGRFVFLRMALLLVCLSAIALPLARAADFLEAEQAFPVSVSGSGHQWVIEFRVADSYYLYRDKIDVKPAQADAGNKRFGSAVPGGAAGMFKSDTEKSSTAASAAPTDAVVDIPPGKRKFDENLGKEVETLRGVVKVTVTWSGEPPQAVDIHSQGCADAGLCYPPMVQTVALNAASAHFPKSGGSGAVSGANVSADESGALAQRLQSGNTALVLMAFFGLGVLLAFTPCVLPMVPILSAVIVGQQSSSPQSTQQQTGAPSGRWRSAALAASYVAGMSLVYTAVGIVAGLTGEGLVAAMQQPAVLFTFAAALLGFGIAMLGAWDMQLPLSVQNWVNERSQRLQGGQFAPVFVMGGLSAVLVGPCVAPPLAGALLYLSSTGDWMLGGAALMALSWGLGAPLIVAAAAADRVLPRAGAWMESVKRFFGFMLIALAIYTAAPVVSTPLLMAAWSVFLLFSAAWAGALQVLPADAGAGARLRQGFAWILLLLGALQGTGAALQADDVFRPLAPLTAGGLAAAGARGVPAGTAGQLPNDAASIQPADGATSAKPLASPATGSALSASSGKPAADRQGSGKPARHGLPFRVVPSGEVMDVIAGLKQPVMLDFYADWCVACKEMERFTFTDASVQNALQGVVWLQVDVTDNTPDDKALLKRFRLFGPPGILFFDAQGQEISGVRVVGFQKAAQFEQTVRAAFPAR